MLRGRDIQRYKHNWDNTKLWLIATLPSLRINIDCYPAIKKYLLSFGKERLEQASRTLPDGTRSRKKTTHAWYELQDSCAYYEKFEEEKIVWKRIGSILRFAYCTEPIFCLDSACVATGEKIQFLTAILNSRLARYKLFSDAPKTGTGDLITSVQAIEPFPVPFPNKKQEEEIVEIFQAILKAKTYDPCANISDMGSKIDYLTYELYDLTQQETNLIEKVEFLK